MMFFFSVEIYGLFQICDMKLNFSMVRFYAVRMQTNEIK